MELLKPKKETVDITIDGTFKKIQDKVTYVMGPLSKLWVMIENANSEKDGNAPVVQMDTVLELLEKTVVLTSQCSNTITYERRKNKNNQNKKTAFKTLSALNLIFRILQNFTFPASLLKKLQYIKHIRIGTCLV